MVAGARERLGGNAADLKSVGDSVPMEGVFLLAKNSPYARLFSRGIARLRQSGALDVIRRKWIKEAATKSQNR